MRVPFFLFFITYFDFWRVSNIIRFVETASLFSLRGKTLNYCILYKNRNKFIVTIRKMTSIVSQVCSCNLKIITRQNKLDYLSIV